MPEKSKSKDQKAKVLDRLRRIRGQVEGVERMVKENKDCLAVVQQIAAARSALAKVATKILTQESCRFEGKRSKTEFEKIINNLIDLQ
jgi:DNA-binding FrmR family transcriptional regulator